MALKKRRMLIYLQNTFDEQKNPQAKHESMYLVSTYIQENYWGENDLILMLNLLYFDAIIYSILL